MSLLNRLFLMTIAALAWWAFWQHLELNTSLEHGVWGAGLWHSLDYFTETTNILAALTFSWLAVRARGPVSSRALGLVVPSVVLVVLVYWPILYPISSHKQGMMGTNVLIHAIIPALVVLYYVFFTVNRTQERRDPLLWLLYPVAYLVFIQTRGVFDHKYPYFFVNPLKVGMPMVVVYSLIIGALYLAAGHALVWLDQRGGRFA
jgi:hypothetical protein